MGTELREVGEETVGMRIAICVGQNEYSPSSGVTPLGGCVNDALLVGELLRSAGFDVRQMHNQAATQENILQSLKMAVSKLRAGDYLVFWNSSHGYQAQDQSGGDELDYRDEAICTFDNDVTNPLIDDKFASILSRANPDAIIFFGSDSCHSGTVTRNLARLLSGGLPFPTFPIDSPAAADTNLGLAREVMMRDPRLRAWGPDVGVLSTHQSDTTDLPKGAPPLSGRSASNEDEGGAVHQPSDVDWQARLFVPTSLESLFNLGFSVVDLSQYVAADGVDLGQYGRPESQVRRIGALARPGRETSTTHLLLSGCLPDEVSWDAPFPQGRHGAMTYYFATTVLEAWRTGRSITYKEAHGRCSERIKARFSQHPQLDGPEALQDEPVFGYQPN
jgi:hypothetical protein